MTLENLPSYSHTGVFLKGQRTSDLLDFSVLISMLSTWTPSSFHLKNMCAECMPLIPGRGWDLIPGEQAEFQGRQGYTEKLCL